MERVWEHPPWPRLTVEDDGYHWTAFASVPWYRTESPPQLTVVPPGEPGDPPTLTQAAAYVGILEDRGPRRQAILGQFRRCVPQLAAAGWDELEAVFALRDVRVFPQERDGLSYVGLVFSCVQFDYGYEHGAGIVLHGDRVVRFGVAEHAEHEDEALIDLGLMSRDQDDAG